MSAANMSAFSTYINGAQGTNWLCGIVSVVLRSFIYRGVAILVLEKKNSDTSFISTSGADTMGSAHYVRFVGRDGH
jgi:hypothetical protein